MATPAAPISKPRQKKSPNGTSGKHSLTLVFAEKYEGLYNQLKQEAEADDRDLASYVVRLLSQTQQQPVE